MLRIFSTFRRTVISLSDKVFANPNTVWRSINGQGVLVKIPDGSLHLLNEVGTRIWELIQGKRRVREIGQVLCNEFEVTAKRATRDLREFIAQLLEEGLCSVGEKGVVPEKGKKSQRDNE